MTHRTQAEEGSIDWTSLKLKVLVLQKTKQAREKMTRRWAIIFKNRISNKGLVSRSRKLCLQLNHKKTTQFLNVQKTLKRHFRKQDIQIASKYMKRCQTSSLTMQMAIKAILTQYFTLTKDGCAQEDGWWCVLARVQRNWNIHTLLVGRVNDTVPWKITWQFLKKLNISVTI